ncbi:MAG TPA: ABC transporter ATP-binding protein [Cytophagaceae bacterium]
MAESNKDVIIEAKGLEVSFLIQNHGINSLKQYLLSLGRVKLFERKKVLKGVDLQIYRGECFGLLGKNGSGKSTLLRTLAGIMAPEKGSIKVYGRIAPVLSLGVGLEPEMTGLENIRLCGTLMGLTKKELEASMEKIINFSELGENIHMQVKRYSSGMMARLAFSIAVAVDPEILIIDEVLSVGDMGFQQKCAARIQEIKEKGSTIIFVSHNHHEVVKMCNRAAYLKDGVIEKVGDVKEVAEIYEASFL